MMTQTIHIDQLPPTLNQWQKMHHMERHRLKQDWAWLIKSQNPEAHEGAVSITYTRFSTSMPDPDNVAASFKAIGDGLVGAGVIKDDSFKYVTDFTVRWENPGKRSEQGIAITITDAEE